MNIGANDIKIKMINFSHVRPTKAHSRQYSKLRKSVRVTQSQNVPLSCLSRPLADRLAEAAYRDILGLSYARAFPQLGVLLAVACLYSDVTLLTFTYNMNIYTFIHIYASNMYLMAINNFIYYMYLWV